MKKLWMLIIVLCTMLLCMSAAAEEAVMAITYDEYLERMAEFTAYEDLVNQKIDQVNSEGPLYYGSNEAFAQEIDELSAQITKIEWRLSTLEGDNSTSARAERAELSAELAELEAEMDELYAAKSRKNQIDALNREVLAFYEHLFGTCPGAWVSYKHRMGKWITVNCVEEHYVCLACSYYVVSYQDDLCHNEVSNEAKAATCTTTGLTEGKYCSVCGEVLVVQQEIAALGHTEVVDSAKVAPVLPSA